MTKAINITQEVLSKNPHLQSYGLGITVFTDSNFPSRFKGVKVVGGYYISRTDLHEQDGFWDVEKLPLGENQKYGSIERKGTENLYHYPIIDLTAEEIQNNAISNDNSEKENLIQDKMRIDAEAALIQEVEAIPIDDAEAMQESIPLQKWWTEGETVVGSVLSNNPFDIRKDFDADNIIRLWKCKQGHTTQSDYRPKDTQALWEMIPFPGEYFKYNPMTLYSEGDIVWFPEVGDTLYRSKIDNNSWSPTGYPQGWEVYNP